MAPIQEIRTQVRRWEINAALRAAGPTWAPLVERFSGSKESLLSTEEFRALLAHKGEKDGLRLVLQSACIYGPDLKLNLRWMHTLTALAKEDDMVVRANVIGSFVNAARAGIIFFDPELLVLTAGLSVGRYNPDSVTTSASRHAAEALGVLSRDTVTLLAVDALVDGLQDPRSDVRQSILWALDHASANPDMQRAVRERYPQDRSIQACLLP